MMHINKKLFLILLCGVLLLSGCKAQKEEEETALNEAAYLSEARSVSGTTYLCYTNTDASSIYEVPHSYDADEYNAVELLSQIMNDLQNPEDVSENELNEAIMQPIFPEGVFGLANRVQKEETAATSDTMQVFQVVEITLRQAYYGMSLNERVILRTGLSRTIFSTGLADRIEFWAPEEGNEDGELILVDTLVPSQRMIINQYSREFFSDEVTIDLYFSNADHTALIPETRTLTLGLTDPLPSAIMQALIGGPEDPDLVPVMPQGTMVEDVFMKDGVCYVDLNEEFQKNHLGGEMEEMLTIYSIVNSLNNVDGINYIQFLIEGKKVDFYKSYIRLDTFLTENMDLVMDNR